MKFNRPNKIKVSEFNFSIYKSTKNTKSPQKSKSMMPKINKTLTNPQILHP